MSKVPYNFELLDKAVQDLISQFAVPGYLKGTRTRSVITTIIIYLLEKYEQPLIFDGIEKIYDKVINMRGKK